MTDEQNEASAAPAAVQMTIHITRKATGLTETYELIGTPVPEQAEQPAEQPKEP